jgi:hypothetical protein
MEVQGIILFSGGSVLCCDSISDTDIINCNSKFWRSSNAIVGDNEWIEGVDEIKKEIKTHFDKCFSEGAIQCSDGSKSPGPDDFNFNFFKSFWHLLEADIVEFMLDCPMP